MCSKLHKIYGATMGTHYQLSYYGDVDELALQRAVQAELDIVENEMSNWKASSDLMRFNKAALGEWHKLPARLFEVLRIAQEVHEKSGGAFDLNVDDLARAWGFRESGCPDDMEIQAILDTKRRKQGDILRLDEESQSASIAASAAFDLSGIAKGYGVDRACEIAKSFGISHILMAIDGELRAVGRQEDGAPWYIGVETPDDDAQTVSGMIELVDGALASSGNYRHFHMINGKRFAHTMNPQTGIPVRNGPAGVTVLHNECVYADAWATVFMVLGKEQGQALAKAQNLEVIYHEKARCEC